MSETGVYAFLANLDYEQQRDYDRLALAYPFEAQGRRGGSGARPLVPSRR